MSQTKHKNDRFKALHGEITRTDFAKQKKAKCVKPPKFSSEKVKANKLKEKAIKRERFLKKQKDENRPTNQS